MLKEGRAPTWDALVRIRRAEGVSLSWLLDGVGAPYATPWPDAAACLAHARHVLTDPGWSAHCLEGGGRVVVALVRDEAEEWGGMAIFYRRVEILPHGSAELLQTLADGAAPVRWTAVDPDYLAAVQGGQLGPADLYGEREALDAPAPLPARHPLDRAGVLELARNYRDQPLRSALDAYWEDLPGWVRGPLWDLIRAGATSGARATYPRDTVTDLQQRVAESLRDPDEAPGGADAQEGGAQVPGRGGTEDET